jgi:uncharacterized circularly permuted ATP-grasp superfamily protein/uncharacterized alpha-E superfamily protein
MGSTSVGQGFVDSYATSSTNGHFDELHGMAFDAMQSSFQVPLAPLWDRFLGSVGAAGFEQLDKKQAELAQQIRSNGVSYNVYAQSDASTEPARPWALDLFPFLLSGQEWQAIEAGITQRARVLEGIMADVYGEQKLLKDALLPAALTQGHRGYLRGMHGARIAGGRHLHVAAFDIARSPAGAWWVVSQRTQAPSGLGYLLENRSIISRLFQMPFKDAQVHPLESTYQTLVASMRALSPGGAQAHIALLTPGPYNETYFEHAYLARQLGLTLVEGSDLTVRNQKLYLKTLHGLEQIHGLLKRLDDVFLDPLELRSDSALGVPGLLQCIRAGHVLVANAPGSEFLESPALLGFMPGITQALLGEQLLMPALPTWWCGERAALDAVLPRLGRSVIKPSYPYDAQQPDISPALGKYMSDGERDAMAGRMLREGNAYTVQSYMPLSQMPTWQTGRVMPKSAMLRVFAVSDGAKGWRVLPGGLMRIAALGQEIASMQSGGSSADVWVCGSESPLASSQPLAQKPPMASAKRLVTSRSAENLFWLGRYSERTECGLQTAQHILSHLATHHDAPPDAAMQRWLSALAVQNSLVLPTVPDLTQSPRVFERSLLAALGDRESNYSVGFNLQALRGAAFNVRERLSQEQWDLIVQSEQSFAQQSAGLMSAGEDAAPNALALLSATGTALAAITGAQTDRMTRDDGWRLLSAGRLLERLQFLAASLRAGLEHGTLGFHKDESPANDHAGFDAMLDLFDSTTTFRALHSNRHDMPALLEVLVLDPDHPRSLAWVVKTLRGRLAKLSGDLPQGESALSLMVPDTAQWRIDDMLPRDAQDQPAALLALLSQCTDAVTQVTQAIGEKYFTHSHFRENSVGT